MSYKSIFLITFLVALSLLYTWYQSNLPRPVDWTATYSPEDKIPYGTYIAYQSIPRLFPESRVITLKETLVNELEQFEHETTGIYLSISKDFMPGPVEMRHLLSWTEQGNILYLVAEHFSDTLLHIFSLEQKFISTYTRSHLFYVDQEDSIAYSFTHSYGDYFESGEFFKGEVLGGKERREYPDYLKIPYGEGEVYLNVNAGGFVNYSVLDSVNGDYYYKALSVLPDRGGVVLWDAYRTLGLNDRHTPMYVILRYPALQMALYLLLLSGVLYVFFRARREQRPIPVVRPPENRMLEFVATVSALYYKRKEFEVIALKQIEFFLGEVRGRYYMQTDCLDEQFVHLLSERSGVDELQVNSLIGLIVKIRQTHQVNELMLKNLTTGIERFIMADRRNPGIDS